MTTLNAQLRETTSKNKEIREQGSVPAVFYGYKKDSTSLSVKKNDFIKTYNEAGTSSTIKLQTPNGEFDALIHEVQRDPVTSDPVHIDFLAVDMTKEVEVAVPLEFVNESQAVKGGAVLVKALHEVEISALPAAIPQHLEVDLSKLATMDDTITLGDLALPEGVSIVNELDKTVASVTEAKEEPEEDVEAPSIDDIEVEAKGKKEEEAPAEESAE